MRRPAITTMLIAALALGASAGESPRSAAWLCALTPAETATRAGTVFGDDGAFGAQGRITVDGIADCSHSLSAPAPSRVVYRLGGRFQRFEASAAIDASATGTKWQTPCVVFTVIGDGKELWRSPTVTDRTPVPFGLDIAGVDRLELVAETPKGAKDLHLQRATWVEPRLGQQPRRAKQGGAELAYRRAQSAEKSNRLGQAMAAYQEVARIGGVDGLAIDADERLEALARRRRDDLAEGMRRMDRGDHQGAIRVLSESLKAWGDDDDVRELLRQAREAAAR